MTVTQVVISRECDSQHRLSSVGSVTVTQIVISRECDSQHRLSSVGSVTVTQIVTVGSVTVNTDCHQ